MRVYGMEPADVLFAFLIANGFSPAECCNVIYRPLSNNLKGAADRVLRDKPSISRMANELIAAAEPALTKKERKKKLAQVDKETITAELYQQVNFAKPGKEKSDILIQIANLYQLKRTEEKEKDKRVTYYLPLRCEVCPYKANQKKQPPKAPEE